MNIGEILDSMEGRMADLGMSRADLARELGLSRSTVTIFFTRPRVDMRLRDLTRYLDALGLELVIMECD